MLVLVLRRIAGMLCMTVVIYVALTCIDLSIRAMLLAAPPGGVAAAVMAVSGNPLLRLAAALLCVLLTDILAPRRRGASHAWGAARRREGALIRPWLWDEAETPLTKQDKAVARARAQEVARLTLGDDLWEQYRRLRCLEVPSRLYHGVRYIIRPGRRVEVLLDGRGSRLPPSRAAWRERPFLCVEPDYMLPADEFAAQLYIQLRDAEEYVISTAIPQPRDGAIRHVF